MAKRAYKLLLLFSILSILTLSSGKLVGFSSDARIMSEVSSPSPKKNKVHPSQIWILAADCEVLGSLPNSRIPLCLSVNTPPSQNLRKSKVSKSWLTTHLQSFIEDTNSTSVIISSSTSKLGLRQLSLLLSTLHSIQSSLRNFDLNHQVKIAVAVSLSALENSRTRASEFQGMVKFIQKHEFLILVETRIDGESSMGDRFTEVMVERATSAAASFPYSDVAMVLNVKSSLVPNAAEVADFTKNMLRSLQTPTQNTSRISAVFVEIPPVEEMVDKELTVDRQKRPDSSHRALLDIVNKSIPAIKISQHDAIDPPTNPSTAIPVTNPVTTPAATPYTNTAPTIVTVPSVDPITITPQNPATTPVPVPPTTEPNINPVNPPFTVSTSTPIFNPVTTYPFSPPGNTPTTMPLPTPIPNPTQSPRTTDSPMVAGQSWCVARTDATESALQSALDYACGVGGVDCSAIQETGNCYIPNSIQSHASYAFNSYYQKNPVLTNCDFGGTAILVNNNPSTGSCTYQTSSSASTTASSSSPSSVLNTSNPTTTTTSNFGSEVPPNSSTSLSISKDLKPVLTSIILTAAFVTGKVLMHM